MNTKLRTALCVFTLCLAMNLLGATSHAATILKLNLGGTGPDVMMDAAGILSTTSDGIAGTTGDQNTAIEYTGFLDGLFADIPTSIASFSMSGVTRVGTPNIGGGTVSQNFFGGTIKLYDPLNALLFEANLQDSSLFGTIGAPGIGGFFTVTLGSSVPGTVLHGYVVPNSIGLSMPLTNVNGGMGLLVLGNVLQPFDSDASLQITADELPIPEPASAVLLVLAASASAVVFRRRR